MIFVFDLDDTICDTNGYSEKYIRDFFAEHDLPYKQIATDVRFAEQKFDWDLETSKKWYKQFGDEMMKQFPCLPNAVKIINKLHGEGHKIIIATARDNVWHTNPIEITKNWLAENKIIYDKLYIGRDDKYNICETENANIFIDDDLRYVKKFAEHFAGKQDKYVFLSTTEYNKNIETPNGVIRVKNFIDFYNKIKEIENKK